MRTVVQQKFEERKKGGIKCSNVGFLPSKGNYEISTLRGQNKILKISFKTVNYRDVLLGSIVQFFRT